MNQPGFTLIELIIVMGLIALAVLIAMPGLKVLLERAKLEADAAQLAWVFRQARQDAVMQGKTQTIYIYQDAEEYQWYSENKLRRRCHTSPGIDIVTSNYAKKKHVRACTFNTTGKPGHAGTAVLKNKNGDIRYVIVSAVIGRVRVSKDPPASWNADETY